MIHTTSEVPLINMLQLTTENDYSYTYIHTTQEQMVFRIKHNLFKNVSSNNDYAYVCIR